MQFQFKTHSVTPHQRIPAPGVTKSTTMTDPSLIIIPVHSPYPLHAREKRIRFQRNNAFSPYTINLHGHAPPKNPRPKGHEIYNPADPQLPLPRGPQNLQPCQTPLANPTIHGQCTGAEKKIPQEIHQPYTPYPETTSPWGGGTKYLTSRLLTPQTLNNKNFAKIGPAVPEKKTLLHDGQWTTGDTNP